MPGMPRGSAALLAQWVQQGTVAYPHRSALRRALATAGAELQCAVQLQATTFTLIAASWIWARDLMVELLQRPMLETEHFEELDMQRAELDKRRKQQLAPWVAEHWGWVDSSPCKTAAKLRGVWQHVYSPPHMAIAVSGNIPSSSQQLLQQLGAPRQLQHEVEPWHPPAAMLRSPPRTHTMRGHPGITLLFAFPPLLHRQQRQLIQYLWGEYLQSECDQCPGWAHTAVLQWHLLGQQQALLEVTLTVPAGIHLAGPLLGQQATQKLQQYRPSQDRLQAGLTTVAAQETVAQSTLAARTAAFLEPAAACSEIGKVLELTGTYLAAPHATILREMK